MNNNILLKITLPSEIVFEEKVKMIVIPTNSGCLGILPKHLNLISKLVVGCINIFLEHKEKKLFIYEGIAKITSFRVDILSEFVVDLDQVVKKDILDKVFNLKLEQKQYNPNSLDSKLLEIMITKYYSLLNFLEN